MAEWNEEILISRIRGRLGLPGTLELPDEVIKDAIQSALDHYNRYNPRRELVEVVVNAGQSIVQLPEDVIGISKVVISQPNYVAGDIFDESDAYLYLNNEAFLRGRPGDSIATLRAQQRERDLEYAGYDYLEEEGQLRIVPVPTSPLYITFEAEYERTLDQIPVKHRELFVMVCMAKAMEALGRRRARFHEVVVGEETISVDDGQRLLDDAQKLLQEFDRAMGGNATAIAQG